MNTLIKVLTVVALALSALGIFTPNVLAAQPLNNTFPNATPAATGFNEVLDTTQATTDSDDAQLNASCGAPATDASVWYVLQGTDQGVVIDVSQSNYSAGVLVGTGTQGNLQTVACGPGNCRFLRGRGDDVLRAGDRRSVGRGRQRWALEHLVQSGPAAADSGSRCEPIRHREWPHRCCDDLRQLHVHQR
jgi:hypothetical protein